MDGAPVLMKHALTGFVTRQYAAFGKPVALLDQ